MRNIEIHEIHISGLKSGDTILHNDRLMTVSDQDIRHGFCGTTVFGDSYKLGTVPVKKVFFKKNPTNNEDGGVNTPLIVNQRLRR